MSLVEENINHSIKQICQYTLIFISVVVPFNFIRVILINQEALPPGTIRLLYLFIFQILCRYLVYRINYKITAFLTLFSFSTAFIIYPLLPINSSPVENLFMVSFFILAYSLIPYIVYSIKQDRTWIIGWQISIFIFSTLALIISFDRIDPVKYYDLKAFLGQDYILFVAYILTVIFLNIVFYSFRKRNFLQVQQIINTNANLNLKSIDIKKKNESLKKQKNELESLEKQLSLSKKNLEKDIASRIEFLQQQNTALKEYGFINSNLVRKPINQLKNLVEMESSASLLLNISSAEAIVSDLDSMTKSISKRLNDIQANSQNNFYKL